MLKHNREDKICDFYQVLAIFNISIKTAVN